MSLRSKTILVFTVVGLVYTGLLIAFMFYLTTTALNLWENEDIEQGLVVAVKAAQDANDQEQAEKALRTYRHLKGLKSLFEWQIIGFSVIIGLIFFTVSIVVMSLILLRVTKPLQQLAVALSKTGEGQLDIKIPKPNSEIAQVVTAYNDMTEQLKASRERLKHAERLAAWRDAARIMAHEVRNPLTGMRLSIERVMKFHNSRKKDLSKVLEKSSHMILNDIAALETLTKEFSYFARLPSPVMKPTDLNTLIETLVADYENYSENIVIEKRLDTSVGTIALDTELMRRVFLNLLKNALDALGKKNGRIMITTERTETRVLLKFEDDGPGIDPGLIDKVFDPYFTTKARGTGLGLAVVKQIIAEHGGDVALASDAGKGTSVFIRLPVQPCNGDT